MRNGKKKAWKLNNQGISLTELIVVVAILGVLAGGGISMMGLIPRMQVNGCVQDFAGNMSEVKTKTMSFYSVRAELYQTDAGVYLQVYNGSEGEDAVLIGEKGVSMKLVFEDGTTHELSAGKVSISYIRSSGAFDKIKVNESDEKYCQKIIVYKGTTEREIVFSNLTGRMSY